MNHPALPFIFFVFILLLYQIISYHVLQIKFLLTHRDLFAQQLLLCSDIFCPMSKTSTQQTSAFKEIPNPPYDLVVVGELNMDLILDHVNNLPEIGKERIAENMTITLGSSSAILASNASVLGLCTAFTGRVGDDLFGNRILRILDERGLDTSNILVSDKVNTGLTCIYTTKGDRGMITYPGAMEELTIKDINWEQIGSARHLHLSSYYLQKGIRPDCAELFNKAKAMGLTTSLDTNWDPDEQWGDEIYDILKFIDVFLPNDEEAMLISKKDNLDDALHFLTSLGCIVVATCGSKGIIAQSGSTRYTVTSVPVTSVDAIGAGDSFNAGFLSRFVKGQSLEESLKFGVVTGAFSTLEAGGTTAFEDIERFQKFAARANPQLTKTETKATDVKS